MALPCDMGIPPQQLQKCEVSAWLTAGHPFAALRAQKVQEVLVQEFNCVPVFLGEDLKQRYYKGAYC